MQKFDNVNSPMIIRPLDYSLFCTLKIDNSKTSAPNFDLARGP